MPITDKEILVIRGGNWRFPAACDNGDILDSSLYIYKKLEIKEAFNFVNTDFTKGYKGGILREGVYDYIIGMHRGKYPAAFICKKDSLTEKSRWDKLTLDQITVDSLIPNPNHNGKKIITACRVHATAGDWDNNGKPDWDGSHACITILHKDYDRFEKWFELNDIGRFKIEREPTWNSPEIYRV